MARATPWAMARHDQVVAGQLMTQQFVEQYGAAQAGARPGGDDVSQLLGAVRVDGRADARARLRGVGGAERAGGVGMAVYLRQACGAEWRVSRSREKPRQDTWAAGSRPLSAPNWRGMVLLAAWALATTLVFLWYNTKYVQFQGRYLFPALVPWGVAFTLGLRTALRRPKACPRLCWRPHCWRLVAYGAFRGNFPEFYVGLTVSMAAAIGLGHWLESRRPGAALGLVYLGLCGLALICLYAYVVPNLQPTM